MLKSKSADIQVFPGFFSHTAEVFKDLARTGFWPLTLVTKGGEAQPPHHHDTVSHAYIVEGKVVVTDLSKNIDHCLGSGDKIIIPAGSRHVEKETTGKVIYIIAIPEARPLREFLRPIEDEGDRKR